MSVKQSLAALPKRSQVVAAKTRQAVIELAPQAVRELETLLSSEDAKIKLGAVRLILDRVFPAARDGASTGDIAAAAAGGAAGAHMAALLEKAKARAIDVPSRAVPALPKGRNT